MNLINIYIQEVTRRLPDKHRKDIALELESTIFDMLPENYTEEDVHHVLETLGNPALLASKYSEKPMHLIGPKYYDVYISLFKLIFPIALLISFISVVATKVFGPIDDDAAIETLIIIFSEGIWTVINVFIQTFFWLTIAFAIVERVDAIKETSPLSMRLKPWTPADLKQVMFVPKKKSITTFELYAGLLWTAIWGTTYFYADHLLGVYENSEAGFRLITPAFNHEVLMSFWPLIILLIVAEVAISIYKIIKKQWTYILATFTTVKEIASLIIFIIIMLQSNLFAMDFLRELSYIFESTPHVINTRLVRGTIVVFIIYAGITVFDVYRKANIKSDLK